MSKTYKDSPEVKDALEFALSHFDELEFMLDGPWLSWIDGYMDVPGAVRWERRVVQANGNVYEVRHGA